MKKQLLIGAVCAAVVLAVAATVLVSGKKKAVSRQSVTTQMAVPVMPVTPAAPAQQDVTAKPKAPAALKDVVTQKPVFAQLDFNTVPVPETEREAVERTYEKLIDAVNAKDTVKIIECSRRMGIYGFDDVEKAGYVALANACKDQDELVKIAETQAENVSPAAAILFARAVYDAVNKGDVSAVEVLTRKMSAIPAARDAWIDGARYLLMTAQEKKDLKKMVDISRALYFQGDFEGAKLGFAQCYAQATRPKERLELVKEFDGFGFNQFTEGEAIAFFDEAVAAGDDEAALRFLEQIRRRGSEKVEELTLKYLASAASRDVSLDYPVQASTPLVMFNSADTNVALMNIWRKIGKKAVAKKGKDEIERISDFVSMMQGSEGSAYAVELLGVVIRLDPKMSGAQKMHLIEKAARFKDKSYPLLKKELPPVLKEAVAKSDIVALETISRIGLETNDPALVQLGIDGYSAIQKKLKNDKNHAGMISLAGIVMGYPSPAAKKLSGQILEEGFDGVVNSGKAFEPVMQAATSMIETKDPRLVKRARDGVQRRFNQLRYEPLKVQCDAVVIALQSGDSDIRKSSKAMALEIAGKASSAADQEDGLTASEMLTRFPDPAVRSAGAAVLKKLWERQLKEKKFSADFVLRLTDAMRRSADSALLKLLEPQKEEKTAAPKMEVKQEATKVKKK